MNWNSISYRTPFGAGADDLTITHTGINIVQSTDYYPYACLPKLQCRQGLVVPARPIGGEETKNEPYRYGYQGQFAEKDSTTGWHHFALRQYGSRIGRWTTTDPYRQYASPYVGMGNNPVLRVDADGGWSKVGAKWRAFWTLGVSVNDVIEMNGEYGFYTVSDGGSNDYLHDAVFTFNYGRTFDNTENTGQLIDYNNFYGSMRQYSTGMEYIKWTMKSLDAWSYDKDGSFANVTRSFAGSLPPVAVINSADILINGENIYSEKATSLDKQFTKLELAVSVLPFANRWIGLTKTQLRVIQITEKTLGAAHDAGILTDADGK